jgi:tetratricopeptide (TPR) repeat protein
MRSGNHAYQDSTMGRWGRTGVFGIWLAAVTVMTGAVLAAGITSGDLSPEDAQHYNDCMIQARSVPAKAYNDATAWQKTGGGSAAGHCAAVALIGLGRYKPAAQSLEKLAAAEVKKRPDLAAGLYGQAAQAWILANDNKSALKDQNAALKLAPNDADLLTDRGVTLASTGKYWDAIDDFNKAHDLARNRADILTYRASAYRLVQSLEMAQADIMEAIRLDPTDADAYLERGIIRRLRNDTPGARADWQKAMNLGAGTSTADEAAANLSQLDKSAPQTTPPPP